MKDKTEVQYFSNPEHIFNSLRSCSPKVSQLTVEGNSNLLSDDFLGRRIAIVGTRNATTAGINDARKLAQTFCQFGFVIVSGLASGIDTAGHLGALDVGGKTIAVLGNGVDVVYPFKNKKLYEQISHSGCLVSEYENGTKPLAWHFPIRNRIIAALSDLVIIPEGTIKGGARITVDLALSMGKTICAIPGPRRNAASELPNEIIKNGAVVITDPADVLFELGIETESIGWDLSNGDSKAKKHLGSFSSMVLQEIATKPYSKTELQMIFPNKERELENSLNYLENNGLIGFRRGLYQVN